MLTRALLLALPILLSACLDRKDVEATLGPETPGLSAIPLLPTETLPRIEAETAPEELEALDELEKRAEELERKNRSARGVTPAGDDLRDRARALRERAKALAEGDGLPPS